MGADLAKIRIFHRINRLKRKAGADPNDPRPGFIDTNAIRNAQRVIDNSSVHYKHEVKTVLDELDDSWARIKETGDGPTRKDIGQLYNQAHNIKDIAETYHYGLMAYFSQSLRDFTRKMDAGNKAHRIIVQAHMDVMFIAYKNNIKDQSNPAAEELKRVLAKAIEKHSHPPSGP